MISALSWSRPVDRSLEAQIPFFFCRQEVTPNPPLASREETLKISESESGFRREPFAPRRRLGSHSRKSAIVKTINDGGPHTPDVESRIVMVGMCDQRLAVSTYPVFHTCRQMKNR